MTRGMAVLVWTPAVLLTLGGVAVYLTEDDSPVRLAAAVGGGLAISGALWGLLAAVGWLYGSLVLGALPAAYHLLASLPALAALLALLRWTQQRSVALATICLRALNVAVVGGQLG